MTTPTSTTPIRITNARSLGTDALWKNTDLALASTQKSATENIASGSPVTIDARGQWLAPGLIDLCARLSPGSPAQGEGLKAELNAAAAGGVTTLVCPPDTSPALDNPGLVDKLRSQAEGLGGVRVLPVGALTKGLGGEVLCEMRELAQAGCIAFGQGDVAVADTEVLRRALQYAATFGHSVWMRPNDFHLGTGVAARGAVAMRLGLSGVSVAAETVAIHTLLELVRETPVHLHLQRLSSAAGVALVRQAKAEGLSVTADVSVHSLHLIDVDMGYFDSRARLTPPLRQQADRHALRQALWDGTLDALVSDHCPVGDDAKALPFAEAQPGATALELLLPLALKWGRDMAAAQRVSADVGLQRALAVLTTGPAAVLRRSGVGAISADLSGEPTDACLIDLDAEWQPTPDALKSRGKHTPFADHRLVGRVTTTVARGRVVHQL